MSNLKRELNGPHQDRNWGRVNEREYAEFIGSLSDNYREWCDVAPLNCTEFVQAAGAFFCHYCLPQHRDAAMSSWRRQLYIKPAYIRNCREVHPLASPREVWRTKPPRRCGFVVLYCLRNDLVGFWLRGQFDSVMQLCGLGSPAIALALGRLPLCIVFHKVDVFVSDGPSEAGSSGVSARSNSNG